MENINVRDLLARYSKGECTEAEMALVERWYMQFNEHKVDISEQRISEMGKKIYGTLSEEAEVRTRRLWIVRVGTAAAVFASLLGAVLFFKPGDGLKNRKEEQMVQVTDQNGRIADKAMLTLADGRKINLTDARIGLLVRQPGLEIIKAGEQLITCKITGPVSQMDPGALNTITTPRDGQMEILLSDDTKVWLNAATTLIFPIVFADIQKRRLSLSGEAYFEVSKDKAHPFVVSAQNQVVEVLGTHFNISAYVDELVVKTTLLEGSVKVSSLAKDGKVFSSVILRPDQQALGSGETIDVVQVETEDMVAWKDGDFVFRKEPLENIMIKLARRYNVEVVYEDRLIRKQRFGGSISSQAKLHEVLEMLELTGGVHFRTEGKKVFVQP
ncbi:MAG TPA: FecR domain-containing protein [Pedobacter sp.]|uniref:FecR family protein n=1 Tax=Pedobacter sp. TaxID=1411316 RepID=UPI002C8CC6EA|nr:FecR domain-containing protein [Pedobacter sp.]HMI01584.1 FecR domain-containing protein [Pedobacter sp.]